MPEQSAVNDPKYGELLHTMMDFFGVLYRYESAEETVMKMTKNERDQAFDYFRANARSLGPWFRAFYKAREREREGK